MSKLHDVIKEVLFGEDDNTLIQKKIEKRGDEWVVLDKDGEEVLGRHDTRKEAVEQLAAIEASKSDVKKYHEDYLREVDDDMLDIMLMENDVSRARLKINDKKIMEEKERRGLTKSEDAQEPGVYDAPGRGNSERPLVAFVGASPSKRDMVVGRQFAGVIGKTMRDKYIEPLGLGMDDVYLTNIVKDFCVDEYGSACEPTEGEVKRALPEFVDEMKNVNPHFIVALGKTASEAIGQICEEWVPHPRALNIHGDTGEVARKMGRLAKKFDSDPSRTLQGEVKKLDEEKQVVYGVVMEPLENDSDNNWTIPEEIEEAAHFFMKNFRMVDAEHTRDNIDAYPVESYITREETEIGGKPVKKGSWVMGVKVEDGNEWEKVKKGEYTGFSIDASAYIDPDILLKD